MLQVRGCASARVRKCAGARVRIRLADGPRAHSAK